jgi:fermentation-respiration switch protein FrsA (DUF1100 family)
VAAAFDPRFKACVMCYGGANLKLLLDNRAALEMASPQEQKLGKMLLPVLKAFGPWYMGVGDPVRFVGRISPRPVLFQNGTHDILIPTPAAKAFQEAAGDPKEITWYDSDHVGMDREHTERVLQEAVDWLLRQDGQPGLTPS